MKLFALIADFLVGYHQARQIRHYRAELTWQARLERWGR